MYLVLDVAFQENVDPLETVHMGTVRVIRDLEDVGEKKERN